MKPTFELSEDAYADDLLQVAQGQRKALGCKHLLVYGPDEDGNCSCGNPDCASPFKHPVKVSFPQGALSATNDPIKLRRALKDHPNANLAVCTEGLTVVDVDGPEGQAAYDALGLRRTVTVKTRRGRHYYFQGEIPGGSFKAKQIDVISGASRYVLTVGSTGADGKRYKYSRMGVSTFAPVLSSIAKLKGESADKKKVDANASWSIAKGERNDVLFKLACALRRRIKSNVLVQRLVEEVNETACVEPLTAQELESLLNSSGKYEQGSDTELFGPVLDRDPAQMEWLFFPYIPRFGVTIMAGDPGRGKSVMLAKFVAIVTSGLTWPMSDERAKAGRVLILSAEDNWKRQTLPRLLKAGANLDNVYVMYKVRALDDDIMDEMARKIEEWQPDLVVIDTLTAYMGGKRDMHRQNEVGEFLARLNEIAESVGCAVLGIGHLNKQSDGHPLYRIVGSIGFAATIRSAIFLGGDPSEPHSDRVALAHGKANGMAPGRTILFQPIGGGRHDVPVMEAVGFIDADAADVCRIMKGAVGRPKSEGEEAENFIKEFLDHEPRKWETILNAAEARSIASKATLNAVRTELAKTGKIEQVGLGKNAKWRLSDSEDDAEVEE